MKTRTILKSLSLAMLMPAMLLTTACSNNDDEIVNGETANTKGYTLPVTINVTRQGAAATRATFDGSKLSFSTGDKLFIEDYQKFAGMLTMVSDGKFSGEILTKTPYTGTVEELFANASELRAYLLPAGYENYGFLNIANKDTYQAYLWCHNRKVFALTKKEAVEQLSYEKHWDYDTSLKGFELMPGTAILNFTISGLAANTAVSVSFEHPDYDDAIPVNITTDASGVATFAAAMYSGDYIEDYSLTVNGTAIALPEKEVEAGYIYNISRSVAPAGPTAYTLAESTVGMVVGTDGKAYAAADKDNLPTGVTAVAMVAYKSGSNGLAIALADESSSNWSPAKSTCEGKTAIGGNSWKLPSQDDWKAMFSANGGNEEQYSGLNTAITTAGGTTLKDLWYWSSSEGDGGAWGVYLGGGNTTWRIGDKDLVRSVRACLAF